MYAVALKNTPIFNTKRLTTLRYFDERYLNRKLEMVAYPGTLFEVYGEDDNLLTVTTDEYPSDSKFYIFKQFVRQTAIKPKPRRKEMPTKKEIVHRLESFPFTPYIWGGNAPEGVPELSQMLPHHQLLTPFEKEYLQLKGVDCSGLIYHVTNGSLPRNTSDLLNIGEKVSTLKPLDLVIWPGHVIIALPNKRFIECCEFFGRLFSDQNARLSQVEHHNPSFIRWY